MVNQMGGNVEDRLGGAVILLQTDDFRAWKVPLKAQNIAHFRAAPAIDRLVIIAHAANVLMLLGEEPQPQILAHVGVLILIDQDVAEAALIIGKDIRMGLENGNAVQQQIPEIAGIQRPQPLLILGIKRDAFAVGKAMRVF